MKELVIFQGMFDNNVVAVGFWVSLQNLVDLQHLASKFTDLGAKMTFHHKIWKVPWSWTNLGDFLAFGQDFVVKSGEMLSLLV